MTFANPASFLRLAAFIAGILLAGFAVSMTTDPKVAYAGFVKPSFAPPAWLFGPVWSLLYVMIAVAGWRIYERAPSSRAMLLWWLQLALNLAWTPVFFAAGARSMALVVIAALLVTILLLIAELWRQDRLAAWLLVPYAAWVAFASALNAAIVWLN